MRIIFALLAAFVLAPISANAESLAPAALPDFCVREAQECVASAPASAPMASLALIMEVNQTINLHTYQGDLEKYGIPDRWSILEGNDTGDCEDYALTKRHALIARGVPSGAMALAIIGRVSMSHAVLFVRLEDGTIEVLDNQRQETRQQIGDSGIIAISAWGDLTAWRVVSVSF